MAFLWDRLNIRFPISVLQSFMTCVSVLRWLSTERLLQSFSKVTLGSADPATRYVEFGVVA